MLKSYCSKGVNVPVTLDLNSIEKKNEWSHCKVQD